MRRLWALVAVSVGVFSAACIANQELDQRIVVITVDTLRFDAFSNHSEAPLKFTERRFEECASFVRCFSSTSTTQPTHATLFTDLHPWQHGVTRNGIKLSEEHRTLAEILSQSGFRTAAVVASVPVSRVFGFDQGFDEFRDDFSHVLRPGGTGVVGQKYYSLAGSVTDTAISLLDELGDSGRQFLWIHYFDPHAPYGDSGENETIRPMPLVRDIVDGKTEREAAIQRARTLYDQDIREMDRNLNRLFARLDRDAGRVETHVIFTSDHGESFGEDDSMAHGRRLTPPQIHVPFYLCSPTFPPGAHDVVAGSIDLMPTVLSLAGVQAGAGQGRDLTEPVRQPRLVFGMKTTKPHRELRLDGQVYDLSHNLFYAIDDSGAIFRGNRDLLEVDETFSKSTGGRTTNEFRVFFSSFERELLETRGELLTDPDIVKALEALGYAN
jgi:arylsulfatase